MSAASPPANRPDPLNRELSIIPLAEDVRGAITESLWGKTSNGQPDRATAVRHLDPYFSYWEDECRVARTTLKYHKEVLDIVGRLKRSGETRDSIRGSISHDHSDDISNYDELVDASVALAVRLWLMVHVDSVGLSMRIGSTKARWERGRLQDFVDGLFSPIDGSRPSVKIERLFNARNLERIANIQVAWTNNLADHLSMREDDTRVLVFHHVSFLECHKNSSWYAHAYERTRPCLMTSGTSLTC